MVQLQQLKKKRNGQMSRKVIIIHNESTKTADNSAVFLLDKGRIIRKAEGVCPGATSIRRDGEKVGLNLHDGLAYDSSP